jgi:hypothetical protein
VSLQTQVDALATLFSECHRCNRAILEALDSGQAPEALHGLFEEKQGLTGRLEALMPLPGTPGDDAALRDALARLGQAQANAIRSETMLSAALSPHISYHGKRMNPYQQPVSDSPKNGWERHG